MPPLWVDRAGVTAVCISSVTLVERDCPAHLPRRRPNVWMPIKRQRLIESYEVSSQSSKLRADGEHGLPNHGRWCAVTSKVQEPVLGRDLRSPRRRFMRDQQAPPRLLGARTVS